MGWKSDAISGIRCSQATTRMMSASAAASTIRPPFKRAQKASSRRRTVDVVSIERALRCGRGALGGAPRYSGQPASEDKRKVRHLSLGQVLAAHHFQRSYLRGRRLTLDAAISRRCEQCDGDERNGNTELRHDPYPLNTRPMAFDLFPFGGGTCERDHRAQTDFDRS